MLLVTHASDIKYDNEDSSDNDVAQLQQQELNARRTTRWGTSENGNIVAGHLC